MINLYSELKQLALMEANKMKETKPPEYKAEVNAAYERALNIDEMICLVCWVNNSERSKLTINEHANKSKLDFYTCALCDFDNPLSQENSTSVT